VRLTTEDPTVTVSPTGGPVPKAGADLSARLALLVFVVAGIYMVVAVPVVARHQWFFHDEWDFLATRSAGNLNDLLRPNFGHWVTLPILLYRGLFNLFGLRTYLPYQLPVDVLHFTAAALLRVVMRRAGVGPWIATAAAGLYALFGSGYEDLAWGFQVTFVGALVFGLTQLILADYDGPIDRRDWLGLSAGFLSLLCASGLAIIMVAVVGVAALVRRGRAVAAFHTVPLALIYGVWWLLVGRHYRGLVSSSALTRLPAIVDWVNNEVSATFEAMGQVPGLGVVMGGVLIVGFVLAWRSRNGEERRTLTATGALLIGALIFLAVGAWQRATPNLPGYATDSHFLDVLAALVLPGIAVAADAIARRWRVLLPVMLALLLIGIPGNLRHLGNSGGPGGLEAASWQIATRDELLRAAYLPGADALPRSDQPDPYFLWYVTFGWLLDQKRAGRLPSPPHHSAQWEATAMLSYSLEQSTGAPASQVCRTLLNPLKLRVQKGESYWIGGGELEVWYVSGKVASSPIRFNPTGGRKLTALAGPLTMIFASSNAAVPAALC
jgi:hypothetical protein